ncbi:MAG: hypothetical protein DRN25_07345 [Thermoplasmata archaeon]|nr:MAG: hypothetical protein DRN25_07345 [Thermoplasmata archaeon]
MRVRCPKCGALNKEVFMYKIRTILFKESRCRDYVCPRCGYRFSLDDVSETIYTMNIDSG